jgi:hypothetical protein
MKKILIIIGIIVIATAIDYGASVLLTAIGMWTLTKLGVLTAWTWRQASLWAIILTIVLDITGGAIAKGK